MFHFGRKPCRKQFNLFRITDMFSFVLLCLLSSLAYCKECAELSHVGYGKLTEMRPDNRTGCLNCDDDTAAEIIGIDTYKVGSIFRLQCEFGFEPIGGETFTVCHSNGSWAPHLGRCKREVTCPLLPLTENLEIIRISTKNSSILRPGQVVKYACPQNFQLRGSDTVACTQDGKWTDQVPVCISNSDIHYRPYWQELRSRPDVTSKLCKDSIHAILPDPDSQYQALVVCFSGVIRAVRSNCKHVVWTSKVEPPSGVPRGIWYAAFDKQRRDMYFTLDSRRGIFKASYDTIKRNSYYNNSVILEYFVVGDDRKSYYGLAVDEKNRLLYCTDPVRGNIGVWSLDNPKYRKFIRSPSSVRTFQPAFIVLSANLERDNERLIAVSDWNNDQIYIYRQKKVHLKDERHLNISHMYLGTVLTAVRSIRARSNDPRTSLHNSKPVAKGEAPLGSLDGPLGLSFDPANNLIIADYLNHRVQIFDGGRNRKGVSEPLFRPSWASANLNAWTLAVHSMIDNFGGGSTNMDPQVVVMAGLGTGELICFK